MKSRKLNSTSGAKKSRLELGKTTTPWKSSQPVALKRSSAPDREYHTPVAVLRRLDIDPDEVAGCFKITPALISCFGTPNGAFPRKQVLNYLAASPAPVAKAFLKAWNEVRKADQLRLSVEAICVKADVNPLELLGAIVSAVREVKLRESALKAILAHPDVVDATVASAMILGPQGNADRKLLHESAVIGFLPTRKGQEIEINLFGRKDESGDDDGERAWDDAFPSITGKLESWSENRRSLTDGR